jgi:hypothetical protein
MTYNDDRWRAPNCGRWSEVSFSSYTSRNSRCLMTLGGFLVGSTVTEHHVALFRDHSFFHQPEAAERVRIYCLIYEDSESGSDSHLMIFRYGILR